jgi:hypothetical protein
LLYEIGHASKGAPKVQVVRKATAKLALETARSLQSSDEEIRYIKTPQGEEIGMAELKLLAEQEGGMVA